MTRTRQTRQTTASAAPVSDPGEVRPLTRAEFDGAIAVMEQLCRFLQQIETGGPKLEYANMRSSIARLELYRDWWAAPGAEARTSSTVSDTDTVQAVEPRIAELEKQVRQWRSYSRRNEERAKKAQRELDQMKTTRRRR